MPVLFAVLLATCILFVIACFSQQKRMLQFAFFLCITFGVIRILCYIYAYPSSGIVFFQERLTLGFISAFRSPTGYLLAEANILCILFIILKLLWGKSPPTHGLAPKFAKKRKILRTVFAIRSTTAQNALLSQFYRRSRATPSPEPHGHGECTTDGSACLTKARKVLTRSQTWLSLLIAIYGLSILSGAIIAFCFGHSGLEQNLAYPLRYPLSVAHILCSAAAKAATLLASASLVTQSNSASRKLPTLCLLKLSLLSWLVCIFSGMAWAADSPGWGALWRWDAIERLSLASFAVILGISMGLLVLKRQRHSRFGIAFTVACSLLLVSSVFAQNLFVRGGLLWGIHKYGASSSALLLWALAWALGLICMLMAYRFAQKRDKIAAARALIFAQNTRPFLEHILRIASALCFVYATLLYAGIFNKNIALHLPSHLLYAGAAGLAVFILCAYAYSLKPGPQSRLWAGFRILFVALSMGLFFASNAPTAPETLHLPLGTPVQAWTFDGLSVRGKAELSSLQAHIKYNGKELVLSFEMGGGKVLWATSKVLLGIKKNQRLRVTQYSALDGLVLELRSEPWRSPLWVSICVMMILLALPKSKKRFPRETL